jgi:hypothetical protein
MFARIPAGHAYYFAFEDSREEGKSIESVARACHIDTGIYTINIVVGAPDGERIALAARPNRINEPQSEVTHYKVLTKRIGSLLEIKNVARSPVVVSPSGQRCSGIDHDRLLMLPGGKVQLREFGSSIDLYDVLRPCRRVRTIRLRGRR